MSDEPTLTQEPVLVNSNPEGENTVVNTQVEGGNDQEVAQNGQKGNKRDGRSDKKNFNKNGNKDGKKGEKPPRRNRYAEWEKEITITLDTVIPELPKEKLAEPSNDDLRNELKKISKEIDDKRAMIDTLKKDRSEAIDADRANREKNQGNLKGLFKQVKDLNQDIGDLNDEKKLFEKDMDKLSFEKEGVVKQVFGKKIMKVSQVEEKIEDLNYRQKTEKLTGNEERAILKDLKELQQSLPLIKEADALETELRKIKDQKKELGKKIKGKIDEKNKINQQIDEVKEKQKIEKGEAVENKDVKKEEVRTKHPLTIKIDTVKKDIDTLRDNKTKLKDEHDAAYKSWRDQNELDAKIKWMKRQKNNLQRKKQDEEYYQGLEDEKVKEEEERKEQEKIFGKIRKLQPQIDTCDNLMNFLNQLKPKVKTDEEMKAGDACYNADNVNDKLNSGDWKKEKVHILESKKFDDEGVQPGQGKKHKKKNNKAKKEGTEEPKLTMTIETLNYFDSIKVAPPVYAKDIDEVIAKVDEKKSYFIKVSDDEEEVKEGGEKTGEVKPETEEEPKVEKQQQQQQKSKKQKINTEDEEMFPSLGGPVEE